MPPRYADPDIFGDAASGAARDDDIFRPEERKAEPAPAPRRAPFEPTLADRIAGAPTTMLATGAASPVLGLTQIASRMSPAQNFAAGGPLGMLAGMAARESGIDDTLSTLSGMQERGGIPYLSKAYELLGNVLNPLGISAAKGMPIAQGLGRRMGQGALFGAVTGASTPVTQGADKNFGEQKALQTGGGFALGGLLPPVIDTGAAIFRGARNLLDPILSVAGKERSAGRILNEAARNAPGGQAGVLAQLDNPQVHVAGSPITAGEAAVPAGAAEFAGLQRIASSNDPSRYLGILNSQEGARRGAIKTISGTDADLQAAEALRKANAKANYGAAEKQILNQDSTLSELLSRPSMDKAIKQAGALAKEEGRAVSFQQPATQQLSSEGDFLVNLPGGPRQFTVENLHYMKRAMDDMIRNPERFGLGADEAKAIASTQRQFIKWMETQAPANQFPAIPLYGGARRQYASDSVPVNNMLVGRELEGRLTSPTGAESRGSYLRSFDDASKIIKDVTGNARGSLDKILTPGNYRTAQNVANELERGVEFNRQATMGLPKARQIVGETTAAPTQHGFVSRAITIFNTVMSRLEGKATPATMQEISRAMADPKEAARIMRAATPGERAELLRLMYLPAGVGGPIHGVLGSAQGVLSQRGE